MFVDHAHSKAMTSCSALCVNDTSGAKASQSMILVVTGLGGTLDGAVQRMIAKCGPYRLSGGLWFISAGGASILESQSRITAQATSASTMSGSRKLYLFSTMLAPGKCGLLLTGQVPAAFICIMFLSNSAGKKAFLHII